MRLTLDKYIQLTFYAIIIYLVVTHSKGGVRLVRSATGLNVGVVKALQGR